MQFHARIYFMAVMCMTTLSTSAAARCPAGQLAATRITFSGKLTTIAHPSVPAEMLAHLGVTKRTAIVAEGGYFVEIDEGMNVKPSKSGGQVQIMPNLFISEVPTRMIRIDTPYETLTYDELGKKPGHRRRKETLGAAPAAQLFEGKYLENVGTTPVIGKTSYAGLNCTVRSVTLFGPDAKFCDARVRGRDIVIAQDWTDQTSGELQSMHASQIEPDICVSAARFIAPSRIRFRESGPRNAAAEAADDNFFKDEGKK